MTKGIVYASSLAMPSCYDKQQDPFIPTEIILNICSFIQLCDRNFIAVGDIADASRL